MSIVVGDNFKYKMSSFEADNKSIESSYPAYYANQKKKAEDTWFEVVAITATHVTMNRHHPVEAMYVGADPVTLTLNDLNNHFYKI